MEMRDSQRYLTIYRVGTIVVGDRRELCLIKNISAGGMMIRLYGAVAIGTRIEIELTTAKPIAGNVTWVRDNCAGITFEAPIDVVEILTHSVQGPRPRLPRIEVDCLATVRDGANVGKMTVRDISQGGIKVEGDMTLARGAQAVVTVPGLASRPGVVCWSNDLCSGIAFNCPLPLAELVAWLHQYRRSSS